MISFINSWAQGIILAVIIATIIENILPEGNNKKYVKTIIGIYIMFVVMYPLISRISNKNISIKNIIGNTTSKMKEFETNNNITIETNDYIEKTYKQKLEEDLNNRLGEKGYAINSLDIDVEIENEETYGQINSIFMQISKTQKLEGNKVNKKNASNNSVNQIEKVEVNISNSNTNKRYDMNQENISKEDIDNLKYYLNTTYMIEKEKIHINE